MRLGRTSLKADTLFVKCHVVFCIERNMAFDEESCPARAVCIDAEKSAAKVASCSRGTFSRTTLNDLSFACNRAIVSSEVMLLMPHSSTFQRRKWSCALINMKEHNEQTTDHSEIWSQSLRRKARGERKTTSLATEKNARRTDSRRSGRRPADRARSISNPLQSGEDRPKGNSSRPTQNENPARSPYFGSVCSSGHLDWQYVERISHRHYRR
jgi:hypothetical protein